MFVSGHVPFAVWKSLASVEGTTHLPVTSSLLSFGCTLITGVQSPELILCLMGVRVTKTTVSALLWWLSPIPVHEGNTLLASGDGLFT